MLDQSEIRALIPHAGTMCLLTRVESWSDDSIRCRTDTHRSMTNPLRREEALSSIHAFEYGAQAAAIHGGLRARADGEAAPFCYLAALRGARLFRARLDDYPGDLEVTAHRLFGDAGDTVYEITVSAGTSRIAKGRVTIMEQRIAEAT